MTFTPPQAVIFRKLLGLGLIALGLLGATSLAMKEIPLALFGEHTQGTVKKVEVIQTSTASNWVHTGRNTRKSVSRGGESTFMDIDFTTKTGQPHEVRTLATFHTVAKVGDQHPMVYLPWQPERAKIYSAKQLWMPLCVGTLFSIVCFSLGLFLFRRRTSKFPTE